MQTKRLSCCKLNNKINYMYRMQFARSLGQKVIDNGKRLCWFIRFCSFNCTLIRFLLSLVQRWEASSSAWQTYEPQKE